MSEYAIFFNSAMIISGILVWPFALHTFKKDKVLGALYFLTSIALVGVGIFPETSELHYPVSAMFFIMSFITIIYIGAINRKSMLGKVAILSGVLGFLSLLFFNPFLETVEVFIIAAWLAMLAIKENKL